MSDGGGESGKEKEQDAKRKPGVGGDDHGRAIARIAVAQICENVGFQSFQQSALENLSIVATRYLQELGKSAHLYANLAGRTDCNVSDIVQGLEDLGSAQGFSGASDVNHSSASSGTVREIMQYVNMEEEIPFARPVPHFPIVRSRKLTPSFLQVGQNPDREHIPGWLPAFPDPHTYAHTLTPTSSERASDSRMDKIDQARQQRKVERAFLSLRQQLGCNGSAGSSVDPGDVGKAKYATQNNPYLAPPLPFGEKDVSPVVCPFKISKAPVRNQGSVLMKSAPALTTENGGFCNFKDVEKKVLPNNRDIVHFKFVTGQKSLEKKRTIEQIPWFADNAKNEKRRKVELILKDSMENPEELSQL